MKRSSGALALLLCAAAAGIFSMSTPGTSRGHGLHGLCCPACRQPCQATAEVTKVKKHCWEVECKNICVPAIKWPWQSCCEPPRCGYVKTVKVLKKVEYECEKCGYKWEAPPCPCQTCAP